MTKLSNLLRTVSAAILFGGGAAVVFTAVALVKAATAAGVPVAEAATANSPIFINFSKVAFAAASVLLMAELIDLKNGIHASMLVQARRLSGFLAFVTAGVFTLGIVPPMEALLPTIKTVESAHAEFHKLHEISRTVFGGTIFFSFLSLVLPIFQNNSAASSERTRLTAELVKSK